MTPKQQPTGSLWSQWQPYDGTPDVSPREALLALVDYLDRRNLDRLVSATASSSFRVIVGTSCKGSLPTSTSRAARCCYSCRHLSATVGTRSMTMH